MSREKYIEIRNKGIKNPIQLLYEVYLNEGGELTAPQFMKYISSYLMINSIESIISMIDIKYTVTKVVDTNSNNIISVL